MHIRIWRGLALTVVALSLGVSWAHVLELPAKIAYDSRLYAAVNSSMYGGFKVAGAVLMPGGILLTAALAFLDRRDRRRVRVTVVSAVACAAAFVGWWILVYPVNAEIVRTWESIHPEGVSALTSEQFQRPPDAVVAAWARLRPRWEYGHAVVFALQLAGFLALVCSALVRPHESRLEAEATASSVPARSGVR
jgi:hypothetical protein